MIEKPKAIFNWSGGKDSSFALFLTLHENEFEIHELLTTIGEETQRISMHGVRLSLLKAQANALKLPLSTLVIPSSTSHGVYEEKMKEYLLEKKAKGLEFSIFGDIFLEDLRTYREDKLNSIGMKAVFPLWKRDTHQLANDFIKAGFKAILVAVDGSKLDESFAGRIYDEQLLADLPSEVDPCGENGEFHTFVFDGPIYHTPISFNVGEKVTKTYWHDNKEYVFYFVDLV